MYQKKKVFKKEDHFCYFCATHINDINYKQVDLIRKFISNYSKILPRLRMGTCARHQRKLSLAIKRARFMALLPYTK